MLTVEFQSILDIRSFITTFPKPLGQMPSPPQITALFSFPADAPLHSDDTVRKAVRDLLRRDGFKPTGRSKPASEYLLKAVREGLLSPINLAVDTCNAVSLHSGLPISVVDLDRAQPPFHVSAAPEGSSYVFNASGQSIDIGNLLCLFDSAGPCGNGVKDSQRTKTGDDTTRTLSLIWGTTALPGRAGEAEKWYREILEAAGATTDSLN